jgi:tetratricopeptide (TPR) repeat protein
MDRIRLLFALAFSIPSMSACATKVITFKAPTTARVDLVGAGKPDDPGKELGKTPLTVDLDKLRGKVVRISQPGKLPVYWVIAEAAGDTTEAVVKLVDEPLAGASSNPQVSSGSKGDSRASVNRVMRLLLQSYQALSGRRFKAARELADQAATIDPELAAPQVIKALSLYQEGNLPEARTTLQKAQALDPEDKNIEELLRVVR